jgi:hypothetical protein
MTFSTSPKSPALRSPFDLGGGRPPGTIFDRWCHPLSKVKRMEFSELRDHLPSDAPTVLPAQRPEKLRAHVLGCHRWRRL